MKKIISFFLVLILVFSFSLSAIAAGTEDSAPKNQRSLGYNSGSGSFGSFGVVVDGSGTGQTTIRIYSPNQNQRVYFTIKDPNGNTVVDRSSFDGCTNCGVFPLNGDEQIFGTFSAPAGTYTVSYFSLVDITFHCWIYNW